MLKSHKLKGLILMINFTEFAAQKAFEMLKANNKLDAGIRIFVKSGGCSGYSYGMAIDDKQLEGDQVFEDKGVKIYVDQMSLPLVDGSEVDFLENMMGGGFSVNNPNATSACGCGSSFRTDGAAAPDGEGASCH
ncbi:MAG TPA: iron-sulfur cluster assembly accessory protein [Trueperaceae bacterium]|nr:iron-sulfur cluster assembly accessory protein [Trueperaceae bacterium]